MENKKLFNVLITDTDGTELINCQTDCIIGALSYPRLEAADKMGGKAICCINSSAFTIINTLLSIAKLRDSLLQENPELRAVFELKAAFVKMEKDGEAK